MQLRHIIETVGECMGWVGKCVGGVRGAVGRGVGGGVGKCVEVWGEVRKYAWGVEKCGRVYGVSRWVGKCAGMWERNEGGVGRVWGPNKVPLTLPHISSLTSLPLLSPFPTSPPHPNTLSYTSHTSSRFSPSSPTPQLTFLHLSPHLPSPVSPQLLKVWWSKLPCDKVSVAKLPCADVAKLLVTEINR